MNDGEVVEYWRVTWGWWVGGSWSEDALHIEHWRATFHVNTRWVDHPWSQKWNDHRGADFVNCWAIEREREYGWNPEGRGTSYDWKLLRVTTDPDTFLTLAAAEARAHDMAVERIGYLKRRTAETEAAIAALAALTDVGEV